MADKKQNRSFHFSVEGETEKWYLEWLQQQINNDPRAVHNVSVKAKVQQSPKKYAKTVNLRSTSEVTHICDYESNESVHKEKFREILSGLKEANELHGTKLRYYLGYSNFTFELWIVLHKMNGLTSLADRKQYLPYINREFSEKFENLDEYKHEDNFKRCLSKLSLDDVINAIRRAKNMMKEHEQNGWQQMEYKGFRYYENNPSLTIWESVEKILKKAKVITEEKQRRRGRANNSE